jgi:hypothetical protein
MMRILLLLEYDNRRFLRQSDRNLVKSRELATIMEFPFTLADCQKR